MKHNICWSRLVRIHLNLRRLVVFLNILSLILVHPVLDIVVPFWCDMCNLLMMLYIHVLMMPAMSNLSLHHVENTNVILALPDFPFTLAQFTRLKTCVPFRFIIRFVVGDARCDLEDTLDEVHNLAVIPLRGQMLCLWLRSFVIIFFSIPLIIQMLPLVVHYSLLFPSITLMCYLIILWVMMLLLMWAKRKTCLMYLMKVLIILYP